MCARAIDQDPLEDSRAFKHRKVSLDAAWGCFFDPRHISIKPPPPREPKPDGDSLCYAPMLGRLLGIRRVRFNNNNNKKQNKQNSSCRHNRKVLHI